MGEEKPELMFSWMIFFLKIVHQFYAPLLEKWLFCFTGMLTLLQFASLKQCIDWGDS